MLFWYRLVWSLVILSATTTSLLVASIAVEQHGNGVGVIVGVLCGVVIMVLAYLSERVWFRKRKSLRNKMIALDREANLQSLTRSVRLNNGLIKYSALIAGVISIFVEASVIVRLLAILFFLAVFFIARCISRQTGSKL